MKSIRFLALAAFALRVFAGGVAAQEIEVTSFHHNGHVTWEGTEIGTTCRVEWAASLTQPGHTNWQTLTEVEVTDNVMTSDVPMFFRVIGVPASVAMSRYELVTGSFTWHQAKADAEARGGHLVTVTTADEWTALTNAVEWTIQVWFGGTDENTEGQWEWVTGEPWQFDNWAPGEPNNDNGQEHYLECYPGTSLFTWNDAWATKIQGGYIIEFDPE